MSPVLALWTSILLGGVAQVVLRKGVSGDAAQTSAKNVTWWVALLRSPWLWCYGFCFVGAMGLWLIALAKIDISYAFPLLSAGYIFVALLSRIVLKEAVVWRRWLAIVVISAGVIIIAKN